MTAFLQSQLDFILFFYGLAFILLGAICLGIAKGHAREAAWTALALFGFTHGVSEWLDLTALLFTDGPIFAIVRTWVMIGSFLLLIEFARRQATRSGRDIPALWLYAPLVFGLVFCELRYGLVVANGLARYILGTAGACGAGVVFILHARRFAGVAKTLCLLAAGGLLLYAVAAGVIVRAAPFWPANLINQDSFAQVTGVPIQLLRGVLACWVAFVIWALGGQLLTSEIHSPRYTEHRRRQFAWTVLAMTGILSVGWTLTQVLGGIYQRNIEAQADGDIKLLSSRFAGETAALDNMVRSLAGAPSTPSFLGARPVKARIDARAMLDLDVSISGADRGYLLDRSGALVMQALADKRASTPPGQNLSSVFRKSLSGAGREFSLGLRPGDPQYYASYPVRAADGTFLGAAVLEKSLSGMQVDLRNFDEDFYFIDPSGVVALTNRPAAGVKTLWPTTGGVATATRGGALLDRPSADGAWATVAGTRAYLRRQYLDHGPWSVVMMTPVSGMFASRVLGIVVTLLLTVTILTYLMGRDRSVRDSIYMDRQLKLQTLAHELKFKATTDPLTGLFNRLKFDEALAGEIARAERYHTPFSLILFDIDHFKAVNDTYGHPAGDHVLTELSHLVAGRVRAIDMLARWGGEEFIILARETTRPMASQLAEQVRVAIGQLKLEWGGTVSCSFGVAEYSGGDSAESIVARADAALYRAKSNGRDRVEPAPSATPGGLAAVA